MLQFELQLDPNESEEFSLLNSAKDYSVNSLTESQKQIYLDMINLIGDARITINGTPNTDPIIIFRKNIFEVNSDMSISSIYPVTTSNYLDYTLEQRNLIDSFILFIESLDF